MVEPIGRVLSGLCAILFGILILVVLFQATTSNVYGAVPTFGPISATDSPNVVTNGMILATSDLGNGTSVTGQILNNDTRSVAMFTSEGVWLAGHSVQGVLGLSVRGMIGSITFVGRGIGDSFATIGHLIGGGLDMVSSVTHVNSIVRPADNTFLPTIKQLRIQQAAIIQNGTEDVSIASLSKGEGGACDNGDGNGGYPMSWCSAPMDSIATVLYSSDPINRECTSYAYWYFTSIEGHVGFHVQGDAKYWASTSNYPTHSIPIGGAIAVETAGAYGHVAIVQALGGQKYAGRLVPIGHVLVSEMNYDWNGHFRYSYSPLDKFSAYIYP